MSKNSISLSLLLIIPIMLAACANRQQSTLMQAPLAHKQSLDAQTQATWQQVQKNNTAQLTELIKQTEDTEKRAWLELALHNQQSKSSQALANTLLNWRQNHPSHPANKLLGDSQDLTLQGLYPEPKQIAVILPLSGEHASYGKSIRKGFLDAYFTNIKQHPSQQIKFYDSTKNDVQSAYQTAIQEGADFIVGPLEKSQVAQLNNKMKNLPILALNYTASGHPSDQQFYEFGLLPEDEIKQISIDAKQQGASKALILAENSSWGKRLAQAFEDAWQTQGGKVIEIWHFKKGQNFSQDIASLLQSNPDALKAKTANSKTSQLNNEQEARLRRNDFDMIVLFAEQKDAQTILPLLRFNFVTNLPVYTNATAYNSNMATKQIDMDGVTICDTPTHNRPKKTYNNSQNRFYMVGKDAYQISQSIYQLHNLPHLPIYGTTGKLTLADNLQIHRQLTCKTIHQA